MEIEEGDYRFLFKGIYFNDGHNVWPLAFNHEDLVKNQSIVNQAKSGISYVRGWWDSKGFESSTRRLTNDELRLLGQNRLNIHAMDNKLMRAKRNES